MTSHQNHDEKLERIAARNDIRDCGLCDMNGWRIIANRYGDEVVGRCTHIVEENQGVGYDTVPRDNPNDPVKAGHIHGVEKIGPTFSKNLLPVDYTNPRHPTDDTPF